MSILLKNLKEGGYFTVSFDSYDLYKTKDPNIIEIQILIKLENSIKIKILEKNEVKWFSSTKIIQFYDEIPVKYFRKEKLKKLEDIEE